MKAISIRAPWWWFILHGGKDIENRTWVTRFRGPVLIHASAWFDPYEVRDDFHTAREIATGQGVTLPPVSLAELRAAGGHIVGSMTITDCVSHSASPWFFGPQGFVLAKAKVVPRVQCKGALGLFTPAAMGEAARGSPSTECERTTK